jgi:regulator of PEP synthase PpsR (kinase-PPPase family)
MIMEEGNRNMKQQIFLVSDSTGITVEALAHSLLAQFPDIAFELTTYRYVDSPEKIDPIIEMVAAYGIDADSNQPATTPIIISTLVDGQLRAKLESANAHVFDIMAEFLTPLEEILHAQASPSLGQTHGQQENRRYQNRMDAVNFALINDDGVTDKHLGRADVILIGPSRTGKTPTCLYLAMQYGIYAANYPLVEEDFDLKVLPASLLKYKERLFGLTIEPERLHEIRQARRADSEYASLPTCEREVNQVNRMYRENRIPVCDVTQRSIEEIATLILPQLPSAS